VAIELRRGTETAEAQVNIPRRIDEWARRWPARTAHVSGGRRLSYAKLRAGSDALAAHLFRTLGGDRSPVAIVGHKEPEILVGFLGAAKARHPYVPIDRVVPAHRVERIVAAAGCRVVLTPDDIAAIAASSARPPRVEPEPGDPYYVMFTSGSTGEPKGVVITLGSLAYFLRCMFDAHRFRPAETFLGQVSYAFDVSVMDTYLALLTGGTVFSITKEDVDNPRQLYAALRQSSTTTWVSTPSFAGLCLVERRFAAEMLPRLRRFLFCGEALAPEIAAQLLERFPQAEIWNTYGPTEATVAATAIRIDGDILARYSPLPIGRALPGCRVVVVDAAGHPVADGERGEILIAGPNVSPGYLGRPDLTARAFATYQGAPAYRTGDWGHVQDGLLFCDGRMDDQVKLHGYRIELGDIEANLRGLAGVRDAVVVPVPKDDRVRSLAAFVILSDAPVPADAAAARALRARLAERLPAYMLPSRIVFVERFPMTPNGKADRRRLAALLT
jgi:D-alanine--poly(phosphoribitol) ligase subunit 1